MSGYFRETYFYDGSEGEKAMIIVAVIGFIVIAESINQILEGDN